MQQHEANRSGKPNPTFPHWKKQKRRPDNFKEHNTPSRQSKKWIRQSQKRFADRRNQIVDVQSVVDGATFTPPLGSRLEQYGEPVHEKYLQHVSCRAPGKILHWQNMGRFLTPSAIDRIPRAPRQK